MDKKDYRAYFENNIYPLNFLAYTDKEAIRIAKAHQTLYSRLKSVYIYDGVIKIYDGQNIGKFSRKAKKWINQRVHDKTMIVFVDGKRKVL
jgi:hypothetical protein